MNIEELITQYKKELEEIYNTLIGQGEYYESGEQSGKISILERVITDLEMLGRE